jgi:hypothetical protein
VYFLKTFFAGAVTDHSDFRAHYFFWRVNVFSIGRKLEEGVCLEIPSGVA